jgi:hypothetical protein
MLNPEPYALSPRSRDDGTSWRPFAVVEPAVPALLQFSYPTMLAIGRGTGGAQPYTLNPKPSTLNPKHVDLQSP